MLSKVECAHRCSLGYICKHKIDQFHMLANPKNCEMVMLKHDGQGRLKLDGRCELELEKLKSSITNNENNKAKDEHNEGTVDNEVERVVVTGYKKHAKLRTLPPHCKCLSLICQMMYALCMNSLTLSFS